MDKTMAKLVIVLAGLVLAGCATIPNSQQFSGIGVEGSANEVYDPVRWIGVLDSPAISRGDIVAVIAVFPDVLGAETYPGRQTWPAWIVSDGGRETATDAVLAGCGPRGPQLLILVDGGLRGGERGVILSTRTERAFTLAGDEITPFDGSRFRKDPAYRKGLVSGNETQLSLLRAEPVFPAMLAKWGRVETPAGRIRSPLTEEQVRDIHAVNPRERLDEHMLDQSWTVSPGWQGALIQVGMEITGSVYKTVTGQCTGWHGACRNWTPTQTFLALKARCSATQTGDNPQRRQR